MLDDPKPRAGPPLWILFFAAAAIAGGAYLLGRRSGARQGGPALVASRAEPATAQPPPVPNPAQPPPVTHDGGTTVQDAGGAVATASSLPATTPGGPQLLSATLAGSLDQTVEAAAPPGVGPPLAMVIARLLVWWMHPAQDARPGDRLSVLYELPPGQEPLILALDYLSQKDGADHRTYRWQAPGARFARYYTPDGAELEERLVGGPIEDYEQVTSLLRDGRGHKGVDFKTPVGTKVLSPVDGTIVRRNWHWRANGNCLELADRESGRHVIFLHLEEVPRDMQPGRAVHKGEEVALSGNTGHT
ncbi:MAG TPA: M23 family metallopeptidase, partial [Myxococcales bacterium]|nr:M23 family metallopeptidase [Myxococcales bacterium]